MKKLIAFLLALCLSACMLVSCFNDDEPDNGENNGGENNGGDIFTPGSDNASPDQDWDLLG